MGFPDTSMVCHVALCFLDMSTCHEARMCFRDGYREGGGRFKSDSEITEKERLAR